MEDIHAYQTHPVHIAVSEKDKKSANNKLRIATHHNDYAAQLIKSHTSTDKQWKAMRFTSWTY